MTLWRVFDRWCKLKCHAQCLKIPKFATNSRRVTSECIFSKCSLTQDFALSGHPCGIVVNDFCTFWHEIESRRRHGCPIVPSCHRDFD
ncbi:hypothetical protein TNCV_2420761 [Trichonephila clavipes]|uniref:Uncharacterized protein n=1 Tax=Trichonephila clavipes TaxID=2585209 RepID=A0A8X6UZV5_TRICX|nr:hypothetical protein TNCV_2420761 [Trichonephila clavipes]